MRYVALLALACALLWLLNFALQRVVLAALTLLVMGM
jgi:hypothetical protein